jgi:hypothetical protein
MTVQECQVRNVAQASTSKVKFEDDEHKDGGSRSRKTTAKRARKHDDGDDEWPGAKAIKKKFGFAN